MKEFVGLRAKKSSYLVDNGGEDKKSKSQTSVSQKKNLKDYKDCSKANQFLNKINHLEKSKVNAENHNEFVRNNKLILKKTKNTVNRFCRNMHQKRVKI